mmetsp:Transcript_97237/g.192683  ORF Transcript_97237/g.192683 Transcript_97237/m.192683 type:complete len:286 (-) Transcript_97237:85-942(-)
MASTRKAPRLAALTIGGGAGTEDAPVLQERMPYGDVDRWRPLSPRSNLALDGGGGIGTEQVPSILRWSFFSLRPEAHQAEASNGRFGPERGDAACLAATSVVDCVVDCVVDLDGRSWLLPARLFAATHLLGLDLCCTFAQESALLFGRLCNPLPLFLFGDSKIASGNSIVGRVSRCCRAVGPMPAAFGLEGDFIAGTCSFAASTTANAACATANAASCMGPAGTASTRAHAASPTAFTVSGIFLGLIGLKGAPASHVSASVTLPSHCGTCAHRSHLGSNRAFTGA